MTPGIWIPSRGVWAASTAFVVIAAVSLTALSSISSDPTQNVIELVAGNGTAGFSGDDSFAPQLNEPTGVTVNAAGEVFIADSGNHRIRKLIPGQFITTVAGTGRAGFNGDNGPGAKAWINSPQNTAFDSAGNLFIADTVNDRIRKLDTNGIITTVVGTGATGFSGDGGAATSAQLAGPNAVAVDGAGNLLIADTFNHAIRIVNPSGIITTFAGATGTEGFSGDNGQALFAKFSYPAHLAFDPGGNLYVADFGNNRIRKIASSGIVTTVAGNGTAGYGGDGGPATAAKLNLPISVAVDTTGNLFIADYFNDRVRKVTAGTITTVAGNGVAGFSGDGGQATAAQLFSPVGVAVDSAGSLYIAEFDNQRVRRVTSGVITTIAGNGVAGFNGDGTRAMIAQLHGPTDVAVDAGGNQFIVDNANNRIRKVSLSGDITTIAGTGEFGDSGDGGPATAAKIGILSRIALDESGNVFFIANGRVRTILPNGVIMTVAGDPNATALGDGGPAILASVEPAAIALDAAGNLFIAGGRRVRKVDKNGIITTVAGHGVFGAGGDGGLATDAELGTLSGIAVDPTGNLYIVDEVSDDIRKVDMNGIITTFLKNFTIQSATGGGLYHAADMEFDAEGDLFINDESRVIKVDPAGVIKTVSGLLDTGDVSSTGGAGIGADGNGNLLTAQTTRNRVVRVRQLTGSAPRITGISPFVAAQGTSIHAVITGVNLAGITAATFSGAGVTATIESGGTATSLPLTISTAGNAALGRRSLTVTNGAGTSSPYRGLTVIGAAPPPIVTGISPLRGTVGTSFAATITGINLTGATAVTFSGNGVSAAILPGGSPTAIPISVVIATNAAIGLRTFNVTTPGGTSTQALFTVIRPTLTGILPSVGSTGTSLTATITGSYLQGVNAVTFSGSGVTATIDAGATDSSIPITITIAAGAAPGVRALTASTADASSLPLAGFTVILAGSDGIITTVAGNGFTAYGGDGGLATAAGLDNATSIAVDLSGNLFISDRNHNRIRKVTAGGVISTVAGNGQIGSTGLGGPATMAAFAGLQGIAVDPGGNLFIADGSNNRILKVDTNGIITKFAGTGQFGFSGDDGQALAAQLNFPTQVQADAAGNVFIADTNNGRVRKVSPDGVIRTVAGGGFLSAPAADGLAATSQALSNLSDVAIDAAGNLFLTNNRYVQKVTPAGVISTIAGISDQGFGGDGGPVAAATLSYPLGIATDTIGNLFITDSQNFRVRKVDPSGVITTVAGSGLWGFSGDGGPATAAKMNPPADVAVDKDGNLYIADPDTARVRKVTYYLPVISTITPTSSAPGTSITAIIRGVALGNATAVSFGGSGVTGTILPGGTATTLPITLTIQAGAASGPRPLSVTTSGGISPLFERFEVLAKRGRGQITSQ